MLKTAFDIAQLLAGHFSNQLSTEQEEELNVWKNSSPANAAYFNQLKEERLTAAEFKKYQALALDTEVEEEIWKMMLDKMGPEFKLQDAEHQVPVKKLKPYHLIAAAAAVLIVVAAGMFFYQRMDDQGPVSGLTAAQDLPAGKITATLTLANGKKIALSDAANGQLAKESGVSILKTASGQLVYKITGDAKGTVQFNTLRTARGQQYQVILPDASVVWLNAASSLRFPSTFAGLKERQVVLDGEAYFRIKHNVKQPFRVLTKGQLVEDIGTEFNINSYSEEDYTRTTLIEGSAKVASQFPGQRVTEVVLKPGLQTALTNKGLLQVSKADTVEAIGWRNGVFIFNNEPIESVMRKISRWYDVDINYQGRISKEEFSGVISRFKSIGQVLAMLEYSNTVHFKVEGRRITVMQ